MNGKNPSLGLSKTDRPAWLKNKQGDLIGGQFIVKKGKFSHFLNNKLNPEPQKEGQGQASGAQAIRTLLDKAFNELGKGAVKDGEEFRSLWMSQGPYKNAIGKTELKVKEGAHTIQNVIENTGQMGMRYLQMQMKFQHASLSFSMISNMQRTRHEAVKKSFSEIR